MDLCAAEELGYTQRLKEPFNQSQEIQKNASAPKSSMSAKSFVRIFRTSPIRQKRKSPDFLESEFQENHYNFKLR